MFTLNSQAVTYDFCSPYNLHAEYDSFDLRKKLVFYDNETLSEIPFFVFVSHTLKRVKRYSNVNDVYDRYVFNMFLVAKNKVFDISSSKLKKNCCVICSFYVPNKGIPLTWMQFIFEHPKTSFDPMTDHYHIPHNILSSSAPGFSTWKMMHKIWTRQSERLLPNLNNVNNIK